MNGDELQLARITNDQDWQTYRKLFDQENKRRGIEADLLPEQRPQPSASTELDLVIDRAIRLWQRDRPLVRIKSMFAEISNQLHQDSQYHYYQARTHLENTFSGAVGIVEDTLNLSTTQNQKYFLEIGDLLEAEPATEKQPEPQLNQGNLINRIAAKGTENISNIEKHIFNFCNHFRGR